MSLQSSNSSDRLAHGAFTWLAATALVACALTATGCDDDRRDIVTGEPPQISVDPTSASFPVVVVGETDDALFTVRNLGTGQLTIRDMVLSGPGAEMFEVNLEVDGEVRPFSGRELTIEPSDRTDFQVVYAPTRPGTFSATLSIESNDPDRPVVEIQLDALETGPRLQITPAPVVFGVVPAGGEGVRTVTVTNVGSAEAPISFASITGSPDFVPVDGTRAAIEHDFVDGVLPVGERFTFDVRYEPPTQSRDEADLVVGYQFGDERDPREADAALIGNGDEPCIQVRPTEVDFGTTVIGTSATRVVDIENCGANALEVTGIELDPSTAMQIRLEDVPDDLANGGSEILERGKSRQVTLAFAPEAAEPSSGLMRVTSDDPARPTVDVAVYGVGAFNTCPSAVAGGYITADAKGHPINFPDPASDQVGAEPLSTLVLTAEGSSDPDGDEIQSYSWSIVEAPAGFSLGLDTPNGRDTQIQLALVGDYVFELTVTDSHGMVSCDVARVAVRVRSDLALIVELTWETPSDTDETDNRGTDLDLHLLSPEALRWAQPGPNGYEGDTYFSNKTPEWGNHSERDDNPALDRDDVDGGGPEQINIRRPAYTDGTQTDGYSAPYQVGVYFYNDWGFAPPVYPTIKIYTDGSDVPAAVWPEGDPVELLVSDPELSKQGDFWLAGTIDWTAAGGSVTEINTVHTGFPPP